VISKIKSAKTGKVHWVQVPEIGLVSFTQKRGLRRISLKIHPEKGIQLVYPSLVTPEQAQAFLISKKDWISKHMTKFSQKPPRVFDYGSEFKTRTFKLHLFQALTDKIRIILKHTLMSVEVPLYLEAADPAVQAAVKTAIEEAYRIEARHFLPSRTSELAASHGFSFSGVQIRNSKSRWGSCSHKNGISLSLHLMRLPDHLIDYVILHELVHTRHKNHSTRFWTELERIRPAALTEDRELNQYKIGVY